MDRATAERLIGRYVTVALATAGAGDVYHLVTIVDGSLRLRAARRPRQTLARGNRVTCISVAGLWEATVVTVDGEDLTLHLPDWTARGLPRRHRRVPCEAKVELCLDTQRFAARLMDVSLGGAAILVEPFESLRPGQVVGIRLPSGEVSARVSSVRPHRHRGLRVVGLAWADLGPESAAWVGRQVAAASAGLRQRQRGAGDHPT